MRNFVVTFARGFGTGGKLIASKLAAELGIHCYENRILTLASQLSGLDRDVFNEVNEKLRTTSGGFSSMMRGLPRAKKYIAHNEKFVSDDTLQEYVKCMIDILTISILYGEKAMYISYDYYRIFYYVAKYGNFTQAAQALMNNQPNITRTIKNLEAELAQFS